MTEKRAVDPGRVAALDLLRGLAALAVALPHFFAYGGIFPDTAETVSAIAVEVFFVLSGYVLAPQILFCLEQRRARHLGIFLARRWMRTIPPYLVALLVISALSHAVGGADFWRYLCYVQNLFRQSNASDYFAIAWSLSVEEWFYLAFPSLLLAAAWLFGRSDRRFAAAAGIAFCAAIVIARTLFGDFDDWGAEVRRVVVFRLDSIGYGFLLFLAVERAVERLHRVPAWTLAATLAPAGALAYLTLASIAATGDRLAAHAFPFVAMVFGALAIVTAVRAEAALQAVRGLPQVSVFLGRISYSTYLFHIILIGVIGTLLPGLAIEAQFLLFIVVLLTFTMGFYYWFELPILAARPRYRRTATAVAATERTSLTAAK